jgi:putative FmdB family regulatory protein
MPTYEYRCNACGRNFEYVQKMSDEDLVTCEACGQPKLEKLISRTAFQLKGSGWYKDLYSSAPAQAMKDSVDKSGAPAKTESTTSTDSAAPAASAPSGDGGSGSSGSSSSGSSSGSSGSSSGSGSSSSSAAASGS